MKFTMKEARHEGENNGNNNGGIITTRKTGGLL